MEGRVGLPHRPLPLVCIAFAAGIATDSFSSGTGFNPLWFLLPISVAAGVAAIATRRAIWFTVTLLCLTASLGCIRFAAQNVTASDDVSLLAGNRVEISGDVAGDIQPSYPNSSARIRRVRVTLRASEAEGPEFTTPAKVSGLVDVSLPESYNNGEDLEYGDQIRVSGVLELQESQRNPGSTDSGTARIRKGIRSRLTVTSPEGWQLLRHSGESSLLLRLVYRLKHAILTHGATALSPEQAGVLNAILLGDKSGLTARDKSHFEQTGTVHLLATAGLHVGFVSFGLFYLARYAGLSRNRAALAAIVGLIVFVMMAGDRAAVIRAGIMAAIWLGGIALDREPNFANAISLAGLALLLANPFNLFDFGFQISFATVITLALGMWLLTPLQTRLTRKIRRDTRLSRAFRAGVTYAASTILITIGAQIGSFPLIAADFNLVTPAGLPANLIIVPLVGPIMLFGFLAALIGAISPILSWPLDQCLRLLTGVVMHAVHFFSAGSLAAVSIASPPGLVVFGYYAVLWGVLIVLRYRQNERKR